MGKLINHPLIVELLDKYRTIWSLGHVSALANWDLQTYMPKDGVSARGEALSKVASLSQSLFLDEKFVSLIQQAEKETNLNEYENGIIRILKRGLKYYQKLPKEFIEELTKTTNDARVKWEEAKNKDDFSIFEPYLQRIIELSRKKAEYLGYEEHPYDALLDEFEEGLTTRETEAFFASIKERIIALTKYIKNSSKFKHEHPLEHETYEVELMKKFTLTVLDYIHDNKNNLRIDVTSHPFSSSFGPGDHRITTRYSGKNFRDSYTSTIHEYGHALYEMQSHEGLNYTPIWGGSSLVIHESQSRFWENFIGRSKDFMSLFYKEIYKTGIPSKHLLEDFYEYLNLVRPSLIRTEADEVTYHLHVLIRFEIEKEIIEGKINAKDIPRIWREKYEAYLGISPKNDREGALQDVHWSIGSIGYFPTYSIGTALSAMWKNKLEEDIGSLPELSRSKEGIKKIKEWLREHVHQYGSTFTFKDLVKKTCGEDFNARYLLDYLEKKYKALY
mgnify:CR=1 FL=1